MGLKTHGDSDKSAGMLNRSGAGEFCARGLPKWILICGLLSGCGLHAEVLTVLNYQVGTTPARLGYNLGHFATDSNAADWFRYSGVKAARIFISVADVEPNDDLSPVGDGVNSESSFFNRRSLLRANAASTSAALSGTYVNWSYFTSRYATTASGNNRIRMDYALGNLRDQGVAVLANITATPSRFPITGSGDWAGKWELWQHYYAQAFLLSRDYGVVSYSMFNEPNGFAGMTEADWLTRYRLCSDAIQSAIADMNSRYGKSIVAQVFAANTANGAEKYNTIGQDDAGTDTWGHDAVANRHLMLDGTMSPAWSNLQVYNYQKYTSRQYADAGFSGYIDDYDALRVSINADTPGEPPLPMALTEFNVRTGANYDTLTATQDSPSDLSALGANCVALTSLGVGQLYLFKFGQTASNSFYGVAKNGTHYVENTSGSGYNYGGATRCAEVYRLFCRAAGQGLPRLGFTTTPGAAPTVTGGVWTMVTYDAGSHTYRVFIANRDAAAIPLRVDFSALPIPGGNPVVVEEVSARTSGGVVRSEYLSGGGLAISNLPGQAVWLVTVPAAPMGVSTRAAVADAQLGDGSSKNVTGGTLAAMQVRADGTVNGRRTSLIRIPVTTANEIHTVLLDLAAATTAGTDPVLVQVYGVESNAWDEAMATWAGSATFLKQNVVAGNEIKHNIVAGQGITSRMLGQLVVNSPVPTRHALNVTDFVKSRTDGFASFLIVQNHRWDAAQPELTIGDTQAAGIVVNSRESAGQEPRLLTISAAPPAPEVPVTVAREANIRGGTYASGDVDEVANGYLMVKYHGSLDTSRKAYFQFDLPPSGVNLNASASFRLGFNNSFAQQVRLWGLNESYPGFSQTVSWDTALANDTASNGMTAGAAAIGPDVGIDPGGGLRPYTFAIPRLGDHVFGNRVTLVVCGVEHPSNSSGGLRIAPGSATLTYGTLAGNTAPDVSALEDLTIPQDTSSPWLPFSVSDAETQPVNLTVSATSSDPVLLPVAGIGFSGSGASRMVRLTPLPGGSGVVMVTLKVSDGALETSSPFVLSVVRDTPWTQWSKLYFGQDLENGTISGPAADPDHDGISNLIEYAVGGNPMGTGTIGCPRIIRVANGFDFHFNRNTAATDLRIFVQSAVTLDGNWANIAGATDGNAIESWVGNVLVSEAGSPVPEVVVTDLRNPDQTGFMRLKVELAEP
jgi:hypothetical protein